MRVTKENIKDIKCYTGVERPFNHCTELLESLLDELEELNGNRYNKLFINYIDTHTEYSPERTDPCPDYYGLFELRWDREPYETVGTQMTLNELDTVLCALSDFAEK